MGTVKRQVRGGGGGWATAQYKRALHCWQDVKVCAIGWQRKGQGVLVGGRMARGKEEGMSHTGVLGTLRSALTIKAEGRQMDAGSDGQGSRLLFQCKSPHWNLTSSVGFPGWSSLPQLRGFCFINIRILIKLRLSYESLNIPWEEMASISDL